MGIGVGETRPPLRVRTWACVLLRERGTRCWWCCWVGVRKSGGGRFCRDDGACVGVVAARLVATVVFFAVPWVLAGGERKEAMVADAGHRGVRETGVVEVTDVDVRECESCEVEAGGPRLALRRREGKIQSPLSLRLRWPQLRVESAATPPLLELGIWNSPGEPRVTLRKTSTASRRHSCAMPRRFSMTIYHRSKGNI